MAARPEHLMAAMPQEIDQLRARVAELEAMERRAKFYAHEPVARYILGEA